MARWSSTWHRLGLEGPALLEVDGFGSSFEATDVATRSASINVSNGGRFTSQFLNNTFSGPTLLSVDGFGSELLVENLALSQNTASAFARLDVTNGGTVKVSDLRLGDASNAGIANALVEGAGSSLEVRNLFTIGQSASLTLGNGSTLATTDIDIYGLLELDGGQIVAAPSSNQPTLRVGTSGQQGRMSGEGFVAGTLQLGPAGRLEVRPDQSLRFDSDFTQHRIEGLAIIESGELSFADEAVDVPSTGRLVADAATLRADEWFLGGRLTALGGGLSEVFGRVSLFDNGIQVAESSRLRLYDDVTNQSTVDVRPGSQATFLGDVTGSGSYIGGGDFIFLGSLAPGNGPAAIEINGDVQIGSQATLDIQVGGLSNGSFDRLDIDGQIEVDGTLAVEATEEFTPLPGDAFEIVSADGVTGTFSEVPATLGRVGLGLTIDYEATSVTLRPVRLLDGDANFDGVVNLSDFGLLRSGFGTAGRNAVDFNLDGIVNLSDFGILRAQFGQSLDGGNGAQPEELAVLDAWAATVPEPASLSALAMAGLALRRRRTIRR